MSGCSLSFLSLRGGVVRVLLMQIVAMKARDILDEYFKMGNLEY